MRVMVCGATGMLGKVACLSLGSRFDTIGTVRGRGNEHYLGFVNAQCKRSMRRAIKLARPDVVLNCIGIVKQSPEINHKRTAIAVNALFPQVLADMCWTNGAHLIHISTDCVFSGKKGNYTEEDTPDPVDLYGCTKWMGEVEQEGCLTLRTSFIGRQAGLVRWLIEQNGQTVEGYSQAIYSGFSAWTLVRIIGNIIENCPDLTGLYHLSSAPISKHDLLVRVRDALGLKTTIVPVSEPRCDRSLDSTKFWSRTGWAVPTWDEMVEELTA